MTSTPSTRYVAYCDGASRKDGRGGWGAHILKHGITRALSPTDLYGGEYDTTNNRMELMAVIETLWFLPEGSTVQCVCDSKYVIDGAESHMPYIWKRTGWRTSANKPVKNVDLWQELDLAMQRHASVTFRHVKGHTGVPGNERADRLATLGVPEERRPLQGAGQRDQLATRGTSPRSTLDAPAVGRRADGKGKALASSRRPR